MFRRLKNEDFHVQNAVFGALFYLFLVSPDFDPNLSGIHDFDHSSNGNTTVRQASGEDINTMYAKFQGPIS